MKCPYCGSKKSKVTNSRRDDTRGPRRRRECDNCGQRFSTRETIVDEGLFVIKKDGRRQKFSREKLMTSIRKACGKRPLSVEAIGSIVDGIESNLKVLGTEVSSDDLAKLVMDELEELDELAYIRYASMYKPLADLNELKGEVQALRDRVDASASVNQPTLLPDQDMERLTGRVVRFVRRRRRGGAKR